MADYWQARYVQAVLDMHQATSDEMRSKYLRLAGHYKGMITSARQRSVSRAA